MDDATGKLRKSFQGIKKKDWDSRLLSLVNIPVYFITVYAHIWCWISRIRSIPDGDRFSFYHGIGAFKFSCYIGIQNFASVGGDDDQAAAITLIDEYKRQLSSRTMNRQGIYLSLWLLVLGVLLNIVDNYYSW